MHKFWLPNRQMVGVTLALIMVAVHLTVGLGFLWPIVIGAAYGAGVLLTPANLESTKQVAANSDAQQIEAAPEETAPKSAVFGYDTDQLRQHAEEDLEQVKFLVPRPEVVTEAEKLHKELVSVFDIWKELGRYPEQRGEVALIVTEFLPKLRANIEAVRNPQDPAAVKFTASSLALLTKEVREMNQAYDQEQMQKLQDNSAWLHMHFGEVPDL